MPTDTSADGAALDALAEGDLEVEGRLVEASNTVLRVWARRGETRVPAVYKPTRGERPLWDFPPGTLARREVAAYLLSEAAGLGCVPATVLRDGPFGTGSVQLWVGPLAPQGEPDIVRIDPAQQLRPGYLPVLAAEDSSGSPLIVSHAAGAGPRRVALLDAMSNNADRKGSALVPEDDRLWAIDNGLSFHVEPKLRTVLWGFAGQALTSAERAAAGQVVTGLSGALAAALRPLLGEDEIEALAARAARLLTVGSFPQPPEDRTPLPWPLW